MRTLEDDRGAIGHIAVNGGWQGIPIAAKCDTNLAE